MPTRSAPSDIDIVKNARLSRRRLVMGAMATVGGMTRALAAETRGRIFVNDATRLNPVRVSRIATPKTTEDVQRLVKGRSGPVSIGGARYSMGGQIAAEDSLHLDMRGLNQPIRLDAGRKVVRVQTGMRWRELQALIDPHDLSVKIMQSFSNFTIGGALSVNAHGRYVGLGPLINSVHGIQLILPGGVVIEANRDQNPELFFGAIGGYGGLGVITEVELDLVPNVRIERHADYPPLARYPAFFRTQVAGNPDAVFHNANLEPPSLGQATCLTWYRTDKPVTVTQHLTPVGASSAEAAAVWALSEMPAAHFLRRVVIDPIIYRARPVVWRNHEASLDVAALGPIATGDSTYALQEYFVPIAAFEEFAQLMSLILGANDVNALNVSVRHTPADPGSILAWAREDVCSFVLYYKQHASVAAQDRVGNWTRQLVDAAHSVGGTYYLPCQLHATPAQFERAYPGAARFFALKAKADPRNQFRNKLWDKYYRTAVL